VGTLGRIPSQRSWPLGLRQGRIGQPDARTAGVRLSHLAQLRRGGPGAEPCWLMT